MPSSASSSAAPNGRRPHRGDKSWLHQWLPLRFSAVSLLLHSDEHEGLRKVEVVFVCFILHLDGPFSDAVCSSHDVDDHERNTYIYIGWRAGTYVNVMKTEINPGKCDCEGYGQSGKKDTILRVTAINSTVNKLQNQSTVLVCLCQSRQAITNYVYVD